MAAPLLQRFWAKIRVGKPDECWPWTAGTNHFGHGRFRVFLGTRLDNNKDKTQKGRQARGESLARKILGVRNGHAKLNDDAVREIRRLARSGVTQEQIASQFGISRAHVSDVAGGKKWRHVS